MQLQTVEFSIPNFVSLAEHEEMRTGKTDFRLKTSTCIIMYKELIVKGSCM